MIKKARKTLLCVTAALLAALTLHGPLRGVVSAAGSDSVPLTITLNRQGDGYSTVLYDNTNGLPTSEANALAETPDGFLWIGSYSGLIRYDGNTFERIDSTTGIASVVSLFADSRSRLWSGTNDSGVAVMEKGSLKFYTKADGLRSSSIRAITETPDGTIYVATTQGVAAIDKDGKLSLVDDAQLNDEYVRSLRLDSEGVIYGVTNSGAVFTMKDGNVTAFYQPETLGIMGIRAIQPDSNNPGYVYIGTDGSTVYYGKLESGLRNSVAYDITPLYYVNSIDRIGNQIWICADNGLCYMENGIIKSVDNLPSISSVEGVMTDYQGNLWLASSKQGVMKIVPNQFADMTQRYNLPTEVVNSTCYYNNMLLIGTKNDGIKAVDRSGNVESLPLTEAVTASGEPIEGATDLIEMLKGYRIRSIIRDSKNRVWIGTYGNNALLRYDSGTVTRFGEADGLPSDKVRAIYECQDGSIMVICSGGLGVMKNDVVTEKYDESSGINNTEVLTAIETKNGQKIIGTDGDGIYFLRDGKATHIGTEAGLSSEVVMRLKEDTSRNVVWIVTSNSLAYMDPDGKVTTVKNFPYSNNFDLYENSKGDMWILSSNGIYVVPADELIANKEINPTYYGRDNGLSCIATANSYSDLLPNGDLYIAGTTGVAKVNIETPLENVSDVKITIPYIEVDGTRTYPDKENRYTIPSDTKKITIYPHVFNYSLINPQVSYHLDGFDDKTVTVKRSELVPINYTNLKGGNYSFVIQLTDSQGNGDNQLSIDITKQKALYELLWFQIASAAGALLAIAGAVMLYIRRKTKVFLKKEQEQKQLIREIVEAFAKVVDMKDAYTNGHSTRVAQYTVMLAKELGYDEETVEKYYNIALMHDIGKIGVPPEVLNKAGKLTDEEFAVIKSHPWLGHEALKGISIMPELAIGAGYHHERPDGKGYPKGLKGDEIPRVAQIIAVADTFDAMYSNRPYRKRMNFEKAVSIIKSVRGTQLTADVVDAFLRLVDKGEFRAPDDVGGGTVEDIDNIHKKQNDEEKKAEQNGNGQDQQTAKSAQPVQTAQTAKSEPSSSSSSRSFARETSSTSSTGSGTAPMNGNSFPRYK